MAWIDDEWTDDEELARSLAEAASTARTLIGYSIEGAADAMGIPASILLLIVLAIFVWIIWPIMGMPVTL